MPGVLSCWMDRQDRAGKALREQSGAGLLICMVYSLSGRKRGVILEFLARDSQGGISSAETTVVWMNMEKAKAVQGGRRSC